MSRKILDDAMEMALRSERLPDGQKAGLIQRLRRIRDNVCDGDGEEGACAACPALCACEELVRSAFAGKAPNGGQADEAVA